MGYFPLNIEQFGAIHDCSDGTQWSASELYSATSARANLLSDTGIQPGRYVVIAHGGTPAFFADLFATWRLGACAVCVNPELTVSELENVVGFMEPQAILPGDRLELGLVASHPGLITGNAVPGPPDSSGNMLFGAGSTDSALVLFTSGTTGDPKGVVHTFGSLAARIELNRRFIERETLQRTLCTLPTHFGHGLIGNCLTPLAAGGDLFLAGGGGMSGAARLGAQIDAHDISFMSSVPSFWKPGK
jgi:acyl-CoA synthetase (AMP-forming)/AMP-acid ligase II